MRGHFFKQKELQTHGWQPQCSSQLIEGLQKVGRGEANLQPAPCNSLSSFLLALLRPREALGDSGRRQERGENNGAAAVEARSSQQPPQGQALMASQLNDSVCLDLAKSRHPAEYSGAMPAVAGAAPPPWRALSNPSAPNLLAAGCCRGGQTWLPC